MIFSHFIKEYKELFLWGAFLFINVSFILLIYHGVHWVPTLLTIILTLLISTSLWFALGIISNPYRMLLTGLLYSAITLYLLASMVYIPVFSTLVPLGFSLEVSTILPTIKDFYHTVAWYYYLSGAVFIALCVWLVSRSSLKFTTAKLHMALYSIAAAIGFICFISYVIAHPNPSWWQKQQKQQALGPYGAIVEELLLSLIQATAEPTYATADDFLYTPTESPTDTTQASSTLLSEPFVYASSSPHIIIYQMESVPAWALEYGIEAMPYLQQLIAENIRVDAFYPNGCHTIDAELTMLCSQYSHTEQPIARVGTEENYYCLPHVLQERYGYQSTSFHADNTDFWARNVLHPKWGIETLHFTPEFPLKMPDISLMKEVVNFLEVQQQPTIIDVIGFSSHAPHTFSMIDGYKKSFNYDISVYNGPIEQSVIDRIELETDVDVKAFLGFMASIDDAIESLMRSLEEKNLRDNTIVVITGDHRYYGFPDPTVENFYDYNRVPFVIVSPDNTNRQIPGISSHLDIAPTILNLIEKDQYVPVNEFTGVSLFSSERRPEVFMGCHGDLQYTYNDDLIIQTTKGATGFNVLQNTQKTDQATIQRIVNDMQVRAKRIDNGYDQ